MTPLPHQARSTTESHPDDASASLLDSLTRHFHDRDLHQQQQYEQHLDTLERLTDAKLDSLRTIIDLQAERVVLALAAADKAVLKAEAATEKRFESVNEFRQALTDQTKTFITRIEFEAMREANLARIADLSSRLDKTEGRSVGLNAGWLYLLGGLSAAGTIATLVAIALH